MNGAMRANAIELPVHPGEELLNRLSMLRGTSLMESGAMQQRFKSHKNTTGEKWQATLFVSRCRAGIVKF